MGGNFSWKVPAALAAALLAFSPWPGLGQEAAETPAAADPAFPSEVTPAQSEATPAPAPQQVPAPSPPPAPAGEPPPASPQEDGAPTEQDLYLGTIPLESFGYGDVPVIRVPTSDGWNLAVYHYPPPGALAKENPVILVHGEGFNRFIWDFDEKHSLARHLAANLYDTWIVELRGHGHSRPELAGPNGARWSFEDYIADVNAVMDFVIAQTGAVQVNLVGHSTGGTIVYGIMENEQYSRKVASGVAMAAPTLFKAPNDTLNSLFLQRDKAYDSEYMDLRLGMFLPAPFPENTETVYSVLFFNDLFLDPDLVERFGDVGLEKVRTDILKQFADWFAEEKAYATQGGGFNYNDDLNLIRAPLCVFAGWRDNVAQPENVIESLSKMEPSVLTLELFGKMNGHQDYYGHLGLLLNDYAQLDVYPRVSTCFDQAALKAQESIYRGPASSAEPLPAPPPAAAPVEPAPRPAPPPSTEQPSETAPSETPPPAAPPPAQEPKPSEPQYQQPEYIPAEPVELPPEGQ